MGSFPMEAARCRRPPGVFRRNHGGRKGPTPVSWVRDCSRFGVGRLEVWWDPHGWTRTLEVRCAPIEYAILQAGVHERHNPVGSRCHDAIVGGHQTGHASGGQFPQQG